MQDGMMTETAKRPALTIALCSLASLLDGYDIQALGLSIPGMAETFHMAPTALTVAQMASLIGMALGAVTLGPLGDRFGRKSVLVAFLMLIGLTTIGVISANGPQPLAAWRFLSGLGMGALLPVAIAIVAEAAPTQRRTALVTLMIACSPIGSFIAGFAAPYIEPAYGWRGIFGFGGLLTLFAGALIWVALPKVEVETSTGLKPSVKRLYTSEYRAQTILLWILFAMNLFVVYSLISWLPTLLTSAGWAKADAQRATGLMSLGGVCGGLLMAYAADKGRAFPVLALAYVISAGLFILFVVGPGGRGAWMALLALVGATAIGSQMALGSFSACFYPSEIRATAVGWSGGVGRIGGIIGPLVLAALLKIGVAGGVILAMLMVPMLVCALLVGMLGRTVKGSI
jgi:MFS transporter, AAHS family, 4-hydroxybenzoate transporter